MSGQPNTGKRTPGARFSAAIVTLALAFAGLLFGAGTASAATYNGACGGGYNTIDHHNITGGTIFLTYNNSTKKNCVVTIRNNPGAKMFMNAVVGLSSHPNWDDTDPGQWTEYAGPVYVYAPGRCIDWGGVIAAASWFQFNSHCGS